MEESAYSYDADVSPVPEAWLALDEDERRQLVQAYHERIGDVLDADRSQWLHCAAHAIVETQLAADDPVAARRTLERLRTGGVSRHAAVHALGSVLVEEIWRMMREEREYDADALEAALDRLDPDEWRGEGPVPA